MKKKITWVICAAGEGRRFLEAGIATPKPLIEIKGQSMLQRAIASLPVKRGDHLIIVSLKKHRTKQALRHRRKGVVYKWVELNRVSSGQLASFLKAKRVLPATNPVVIFNCDTYFHSKKLRSILETSEWEGVIPCARAPGKSWSFCQTKGRGPEISRVAEKNRISPWASVGLYAFRQPQKLLQRAQKHLRTKPTQRLREHYVIPLYNDYLKSNERVLMVPVDKFKPFGTPEQLRKYWKVRL